MRVHFDGLRRPARVAKRLRSELQALGVSLGLGRAQDLVAHGFGYASYKELQAVTAQASTKPDPWDEDVDPRTAQARRARQAEAYAGAGIDAATAAALVGRIGPSARSTGSGARTVKAVPAALEPFAGRTGAIPSMDFETSPHQEQRKVAAELSVAIASQGVAPGTGYAYLDNRWLLRSEGIEDAGDVAGILVGWGHPIDRIVVIAPEVVTAFNPPPGTPTESLVQDLVGDPQARAILRGILHEAKGMKATKVSITRSGATRSVVATIGGNRRPVMDLDHAMAIRLANECWLLGKVRSHRAPFRTATGRMDRRGDILPAGVEYVRFGFVPIGDLDHQIDITLVDAASAMVSGWSRPNLDDVDRTAIARMTRRSAGLNVVAGPAQSGKTITVAEILREVAKGNRRVAWITDGSDPSVPGVTEMVVPGSHLGKDEYASVWVDAVRSAQGSGAEIIMVGEIVDRNTAAAAFSAAMSGHQVWATIPANGGVESLQRLRDLGIENHLVHDAAIVTGLVGQRLLRVTCRYCAKDLETAFGEGIVAPELDAALDKVVPKARERERFRFANPMGCPHCISGFKGQAVVTEAFSTDARFMGSLAKNERDEAIDRIQRPTMLERAVDMAKAGILDLNEIETRVGFLEDLPRRYVVAAQAA
jgi:hypothetical protein